MVTVLVKKCGHKKLPGECPKCRSKALQKAVAWVAIHPTYLTDPDYMPPVMVSIRFSKKRVF